MSYIKTFQAEVEAFLERHDMYPTTFGKLCSNNTALVSRIRAGNIATVAKIVIAQLAPVDPPDPIRRSARFDMTADYRSAFRQMIQALSQ
mgnify:CR=1 FL=1